MPKAKAKDKEEEAPSKKETNKKEAAKGKEKEAEKKEAATSRVKKFNEKRLADKAYLARSISKDKLLRRLRVCTSRRG